MFSSLLALISIGLFIPDTVALPARPRAEIGPRQSEDYNYYALNPGKISTNLMVGALDGDGNREPRQNCIFYVNQKDVDPEDPNYAKNRAVQFADLMNDALSGSDFHTLYDVYDSASAFSYTSDPMASALSSGNLRNWFEDTSAAYADLCLGTVYLIVEAEPQQIWPQSIWLTHELPAIINGGLVTQIVEIRPEDVGTAANGGAGGTRYIRHYPYRGGQPPGATPPRDGDTSVVPGNVTININAANAAVDGIVDVPGDFSPFFEGHCTMHVHQWKNPSNGGGSPFDPPQQWSGPYSVEITMYDNNRNKIGYVPRSNADDPNSLHMVSKLEAVMVVTPEQEHDYIQFTVGDVSFPSDDSNYCKVGGWNHNSDRQMDCGFPCVWNGGDSSDHTQLRVWYP
ncbi:hypothetical protein B0H11DRAFT_2348774 [Mycena galericulata]|nr:hypothetical protein B0H11DRAFT_2348774 [Mycena galericulata]